MATGAALRAGWCETMDGVGAESGSLMELVPKIVANSNNAFFVLSPTERDGILVEGGLVNRDMISLAD